MSTDARIEPAQCYEVAGRVLLAVMRGTDFASSAQKVDYWEPLGGGLVLEWHGGPYAHEVARDVVDYTAEEERPRTLEVGSVVWDDEQGNGEVDPTAWVFLQGGSQSPGPRASAGSTISLDWLTHPAALATVRGARTRACRVLAGVVTASVRVTVLVSGSRRGPVGALMPDA